MLGQPKTTAEYIQASSRVGRDQTKPGLVVVLLNPNRPRDRSHYEHFAHSHDAWSSLHSSLGEAAHDLPLEHEHQSQQRQATEHRGRREGPIGHRVHR